jgi:hypothetical protein
MKLLSLSYKNLLQEWEFENIHFFDLTLLVGISGVGKTQILEAINMLKAIASGNSADGIEWNIVFITDNKNKYKWSGTFEKTIQLNGISKYTEIDNEKKDNAKISYEKIFINDSLTPIIERKEEKIFFKGVLMPKLSAQKSCIHIFQEEDDIKPIIQSFKKIIFRDHTQKENLDFRLYLKKNIKDKYKNLEAIRASDLSTIEKLEAAYYNAPEVFKEIKERFIDIFTQIQDIKIEVFRYSRSVLEVPILFIKEKYVNKWISQDKISSGMLRTFLHISELFLWSDGTVILIDEFENSLGVNCIDVLTEDLVFENSRIQFIATSHHPYIINKIPYDYWKIVTRRGGKIKTHDAKDFDLGDSHHERFMNLINLPQYRQGLTI